MNPPQPGYDNNYAYVSHMPKGEWSRDHNSTTANADLPPIRSWYNPRGWSPRRKIIVIAIVAVVIVAIIVGAYEGVRSNRYPDYSRLSYTLKDTFQGTTFFDNFDYFTGPDPAEGFVV